MDAVDPARLDTVLAAAVAPDGVRWEVVRQQHPLLTAYVAQLGEVDATALDRGAAIAFWIDAYNAITLDVVAGAGQIQSIRELDGGQLWTTRSFRVAGAMRTLDDVENQARSFGDPRVHAALNCASRGCAPLAPRAYRAATIEADLDAAARRWAGSTAVRVDGDRVVLSQVFDWYALDFAAKPKPGARPEPPSRGALRFLSAYVDEATRSRLNNPSAQVSFGDYDWALNRAP
jgi:hypothetical protein